MRCLVTGGAGFIGSHLVERLLTDGHVVTVLDNSPSLFSCEKGNLKHLFGEPRLILVSRDIFADGKDFEFRRFFYDVDWVFHLAGKADVVPSIKEPQDYFNTNVVGTMNVLEASREAGVKKFVYAASSSCYGIPRTNQPVSEDDEIKPMYPYALTKRLGEELVLHWGMVYGLPVVSLRLFNVYGLRSRTTGAYGAVFGVFLKQKLENKPFTVVGDGWQRRDFVWVGDVCDAFVRAAERTWVSGVFNVGSGNPKSINELVDLLGGPVVNIPKRPGEPNITWADTEKAAYLLGFIPRTSFEEGVRIIVEHIEDWAEAPLWTPESIAKETQAWFQFLGGKKQTEDG